MPELTFQEFRQEITAKEFNSIVFLNRRAKELKATQPKLSARILVRVNMLKKQKQKALLTTENKEQTTVITSKDNASKKQEEPNKEIENKGNKVSFFKQYINNLIQNNKNLMFIVASPFILLVILPTLVFAMYQVFWATERYESQAQVIVQQPDSASTLDSGMALLSGFGGGSGDSDADLVKAYIFSNDMIQYLNDKIALKTHYSQSFIDHFSGIDESDSKEALYKYYHDHIDVEIDDKSGVITIRSQAFDSEYAQYLSNTIVERSEWFINSIGHQLAKAQLDFMQGEHKLIEERLSEAQKQLLLFQQKYNLLDPSAEGSAKQTITNTIESKIAIKQTEIKTLKAIMNPNSPQVQGLENELDALNAQLQVERDKLSQSGLDDVPVSELLSKFTDYKIKMDLALQAYTSSQISLEKSRIEAYRQLKYLIVVEEATLSEDNKYPDVVYNISLFLLLLSLVFGIGKIIISTIRELK